MNGIDVSHWQNRIDWDDVKHDGISFAIIKAGGSDNGFYRDSFFDSNYINAKRVGINVGAYYIVGKDCKSYNDGVADANRFINLIKDKQFELPVYIDFEIPDTSNKVGNTEACIGFCRTLENNHYYAGIYSSDISGFKDRLDISRLTPFTWWVARYGNRPIYATANMHIWQTSDKGNISGIYGYVDLDTCFYDFPSVIKKAGLNGFSRLNQTHSNKGNGPRKLSNEEVARLVVKGVYGNGESRRKKLKSEGYNYESVQRIVNRLLNG